MYSQRGNTLFPTWERLIPNVGTLYSQRGNVLFPTWEHIVPKLGTFTELRIIQAR